MFQFEKLVVWQRAIEYTDMIYSMSEEFPSRENFGLGRQIQRAAVSVPSNIAEGNSRHSDVEFARYVKIAYAIADGNSHSTAHCPTPELLFRGTIPRSSDSG